MALFITKLNTTGTKGVITWYRYDFHTGMSSTRFLLWPCFSLHDTGTKCHTSNCIGTTWSRTGMLRTHQATSRRDILLSPRHVAWIKIILNPCDISPPRQDFACIRVAESCRSDKIATSAHMKWSRNKTLQHIPATRLLVCSGAARILFWGGKLIIYC